MARIAIAAIAVAVITGAEDRELLKWLDMGAILRAPRSGHNRRGESWGFTGEAVRAKKGSMKTRTTGIILALLSLTACVPQPPGPEGAWERIDLWFDRPRLELADGTPIAGPVRRVTVPLEGVGEWTNEPAADDVPEHRGSDVHALEARAGTRLVKTVELGLEPYLSFIPMPAGTPCPCAFRVWVDGEILREIALEVPRDNLRFAPATVTLDLEAYAGEEVELRLEVDAPLEHVGSLVYWGSPAIVFRRPLEETPPRAERPNVLLISVDTLRADALGAWGREPSVTPALDRLAAQSDVWLEAFSTFNATNPSFTSILTGFYGKHHGVYDSQTRLAEGVPTLAEPFAEAGYGTAAILAARHLSYAGITRGFEDVVECERTYAGELPVDLAMGWIGAQTEPFLLWLHLFDPHTPHTPPRPFALGYRADRPYGTAPVADWRAFRNPSPEGWVDALYGGSRELYAAEVAYVDRQIDRLMGYLESRDLLETTVVVFVSDHGENLEDHGVRYGHAGLWDTTTHVPLMIRWPGPRGKGRRLEGLVQTLDLYPTLLGFAGLEAPRGDGRDLGELMEAEPPGRPLVFAEHAHRKSGAMVRSHRAKLILSQGVPEVPDGTYLYDLRRDPEEEQNLAEAKPELRRELEEILQAWLAEGVGEGAEGEAVKLSPEDVEKLRALGYL